METKDTNWAERESPVIENSQNELNEITEQTNNDAIEKTNNEPSSETKRNKAKKSFNSENRENLSEETKTIFERNLLKIEKVRNFINTLDSEDKKLYIQFLTEIEKDINNVLNIRLSKREKDLLIKFLGY